MTLEMLVEMDAETLEKMSDEELKNHFSKYLDITRPERPTARVSGNNAGKPKIVEYISPAKQAVLDMLMAEGLSVKDLRRRK